MKDEFCEGLRAIPFIDGFLYAKVLYHLETTQNNSHPNLSF